MFKKKNFLVIILFGIFVLALFLRFFRLSDFPVGFHLDEASKGYSAYSLLNTGKDDNNNLLPLYIDIFGDNSPAGYHYLAIIPIVIFGLTEFATRFPGALFGAFSIIACYFLAYSIFNNRKIGMLSALLLAISPWHINLSRASSESIVALFFIMFGFSLIIWSFRIQAIKFVIIGTILISISFFFYQTPRLFVPLLFLALLIFFLRIWKVEINSKYKKVFIYCFILLLILDFLLIFIVPGGTGRFSQVNIFSYPETRLVMEEQIREDGVSGMSVLITRFFHNKGVNFFLAYLSNYLEYFSWNFLFIKGLPQWSFIPSMGVMYLVELPLVLYGVFLLPFRKSIMEKIPLVWLVLAPTAAAAATDINNIQRASVMFPMLEIIAAYGLVHLFTNVVKQKKLILIVLTILLFVFNISYFLHQYFIHSKVHRPWYRYNGFSQMMKVVNENYNNYDRIVITTSTGGTYPLIQFYSKYNPRLYQQEGSPKDVSYSGFGKFLFVAIECPSIKINEKLPKSDRIIYINKGICPKDVNHEETIIHREDGTEAFRIVYGDKKIIKK